MRRALRMGGVWYLPLTKGKAAVLDKQDVAWAEQWNWLTLGHLNREYGARNDRATGVRVMLYLHVEIARRAGMDVDTLEVDHINGNRLDDRRSNLRTATHAENMRNQKLASNNTSGIRHVTWDESRQRWRVRIGYNGRRIYVGLFPTLEQALEARNSAERKLFGAFAPCESRV